MAPTDLRLGALRRFAFSITLLNVVGHAVLGFEQSWAQLLFAALCAWGIEITLELIEAAVQGRPTPLRGGLKQAIDYLLPAHITGMAIVMLLYANDRFAPIFFAIAVGLVSKRLLRVPIGRSRRHFLNPSNTGIAATLFLLPTVGVVPPYQFTHYLHGGWDIGLPALVVFLGMLLTTMFTKKGPLILAWVGAFALQALVRAAWFDTAVLANLAPMTSMAFLIYTFYMLPDPGTTPMAPRRQIAFGASVATVYGLLMARHFVFSIFLALLIVCCIRGAYLAFRAIPSVTVARRPPTSEPTFSTEALVEPSDQSAAR
ncbi:MAG: enediyne biosynthesis protein UnbU [Egibacteraceae bacterium]